MNQVFVRFHHYLTRIQTFYFKMFCIDGLFKGKNTGQHNFIYVEYGRFELHLACFDLCNVEHRAHQSGKTFDLIGNNAQIMPFLLRRNGSVQNTIDESGDTGHRGLQLMRYIGNKGSADRFLLGKAGRHVVKRHR